MMVTRLAGLRRFTDMPAVRPLPGDTNRWHAVQTLLVQRQCLRGSLLLIRTERDQATAADVSASNR
jgi:hypothetical protein